MVKRRGVWLQNHTIGHGGVGVSSARLGVTTVICVASITRSRSQVALGSFLSDVCNSFLSDVYDSESAEAEMCLA